MTAIPSVLNEQASAKAFSRQSKIFDELYAANIIVEYKRQRVRAHILKRLAKGSTILELNSGTGQDAINFAQQGYQVHATDIATGMQAQLKLSVKQAGLEDKVTSELCSYTQLQELKNQGPFDLIFSNFAGLNCTDELYKVLASLPPLLKPGGMVTLVMLPKYCLWELLLVIKGKFKTATRRLFSRHGATAHVEGVYFKCWYYNPSYIIKRLNGQFDVLGLEGLCTIVPPSYIEGFAEKYSRAYRFLTVAENKLKSTWPWNLIGDYYIISLRKKAT